ncbi:alpha/beta superfamily hydrolase [Cylindrospermum stagnale PCC 7417]|uniref:Alpha/beta superfamily hydrolase n=1 Tax=Cylindrospermum stagnale PCC 7417 TaxID=56107 RepID=K9WZ79_9NOST|nr:alpha/beta fold hydrolase [Cylindrospermum stagnale]AFZ25114.1 alpha/beta superfamily hydrolase [Cylindrospermum stagnale PCC 7417]
MFVTHKLKRKQLLICIGILAIAYSSACLLLFLRQRYVIFRPSSQFLTLPSSPDFQLPYQDERISIAGSSEYIHGWWIAAPTPQEKLSAIPNEPTRVLTSPKVILYFCGAAGNKGYYNHVARLQGLRQLGFSVLVIDYRGFGSSQGNFPSESQLYQDSQIAWDYLVRVRRIPPEQIVIYGESLGGAVAINLAIQHSEASALIIQSSFTSMAEEIKHRNWLWMFPVDLLLTQRFDSISKVSSLRLPVLFIHGTADSVVPSYMSQQLYNAAPEPKQLFLIPGGEHFRIYQPGRNSYFQAIQKFIEKRF